MPLLPAAIALLVELVLPVELLVEECIPEALPVEPFDFDALASRVLLEEIAPVAARDAFAFLVEAESVDRDLLWFFVEAESVDREAFWFLVEAVSADREALAFFVAALSAETEDVLLAVAFNVWLWSLLLVFAKVSAVAWLTVRL